MDTIMNTDTPLVPLSAIADDLRAGVAPFQLAFRLWRDHPGADLVGRQLKQLDRNREVAEILGVSVKKLYSVLESPHLGRNTAVAEALSHLMNAGDVTLGRIADDVEAGTGGAAPIGIVFPLWRRWPGNGLAVTEVAAMLGVTMGTFYGVVADPHHERRRGDATRWRAGQEARVAALWELMQGGELPADAAAGSDGDGAPSVA